MGTLTYSYKKAVFDEMLANISANVSNYYAFASDPVAYTGNTPSIIFNDYNINFLTDWQMIFGKKLQTNNIVPVIVNNLWETNTVYNRYDNTVEGLDNFYVVAPPATTGASYNVYKCIDNANNSPSIYVPSLIQSNTFYTGDNYAWRYMFTVSNQNFGSFAAGNYIPVIANNIIMTNAANNSGVDVVMVSNSGVGYNSYHDGIVQSLSSTNSSLIQISSNASIINSFYNNNAIYIYSAGNTSPTTSQLLLVNNYVSNTSGNWVYTNSAINSTYIIPGQTNYKISPAVIFNTDGVSDPQAYSVVNTSSNSISNVVIIQTGSNISWANVYITSNANFGTGANIYAICPPPGGHGSNPAVELQMQGCSISFNFSGTESGTIPTSLLYNKIGVCKNPYAINLDGSQSSNLYTSNTFNNIVSANVSALFTVGDIVYGSNSGSYGIVAFSNSSTVFLTGDKTFQNSETLISTTSNTTFSNITINSGGQIYAKNISPMYIQNINNVPRSNTNSESFKLIVQI